MRRGYMPSWARPSQKEKEKVLDEFNIKGEGSREDAMDLAEEVCLLREERDNLQSELDKQE